MPVPMVIIVAAATCTKRKDGTPQHPGAMAQCSGSKFEQQDAWHKWQQEAQSRVHLGPHFAGFVAMSHIRLNIDAMKDLHNPSSVYRSVASHHETVDKSNIRHKDAQSVWQIVAAQWHDMARYLVGPSASGAFLWSSSGGLHRALPTPEILVLERSG